MDIQSIDLEKCKPGKDFGKGFYLTTILSQAQKMAKKVGERNKIPGVINTFECDDNILNNNHQLNIKVFDEANIEWAEFIYNNREIKSFCHGFDIVIGPIADDGLRDLLIKKRFGLISSEELAKQLRYNKEDIQWCFLTQKSLTYLKKI